MVSKGFDVPAANVVISFDPIKNSVELCQRFGRARQQDSSIVVLDERADRRIPSLERVRETQESIIADFDLSRMARMDDAAELQKQQSRERNAASVLQQIDASPLASLNLYVKKTKAHLDESYHQGKCVLQYKTILRTVEAQSNLVTQSKKAAKRRCALKLLEALKAETNQ